jgi:mannitol-specific phosphotransferase system IIBC component
MDETMNVDSPSERRRRRIPAAVIGLFCGALIGFVIGLLVKDVPGGIVLAFVGALLGAVMGSGVIGIVGRTMLVGAVVGGFAAILLTGYGKAALHGVPIGTLVGLALGLALEKTNGKRKPPPD